jgi:hypothetical protein
MKLAELRERAESCLLLVDLEVSLAGLTKAELLKIWDWAQVLAYEASDNPCRARHAPKALRERLPADHYLQRWRMPKRKAAVR